jgi:hypothetical protein
MNLITVIIGAYSCNQIVAAGDELDTHFAKPTRGIDPAKVLDVGQIGFWGEMV